MTRYVPKEYWETRLKSRFDLTGVGNIGFSTKYNDYLYRLQSNVLKKALKRHKVPLKDRNVLDIGCGTGFFSRFYIGQSADVTGVDITSTSIEMLKESLPQGKFLTFDITSDIPLKKDLAGSSFDLINVFGILYHIVDDSSFKKAMDNICGLLNKGGYLIISDFFGDKNFIPANHVKFRAIENYGMLEQAGIKVLEVAPIYHFMNRRLKGFSMENNNRLAPVLYAMDVIINGLGIFKGKDIRLLIAKKSETI